MADIPWALKEGEIRLGDAARIPCAVLDNEERVLTQQGFLRALGRARTARNYGASVDQNVAIFGTKNLVPFIPIELLSTKPILFKPLKGGYAAKGGAVAIAYGFKATDLPKVLQVYVDAQKAGALRHNQIRLAEVAKRMLDALPKVGMSALVDEATACHLAPHDELQRSLEAYVLPEHRSWIKTLPREFTSELYRVYGWNTPSRRVALYTARLTRKLLYESLPAPMLPEPDRSPRGKRHHPELSEQVDVAHFRGQLSGVMALLRASPNKAVFERLFERAYGQQQHLFGEHDLPDIPTEAS
jgi:P63C domain-containing protein